MVCLRRWVWFWAALGAVAFIPGAAAGQAAEPASAATGATHPVVLYQWPVTAAVVDGFRPPSHFAGAGNRGLEFGTAGGEPVVAAASGQVVFAGAIAGANFVTVQHRDGLRTSYSHIRNVTVFVGNIVAGGTAIGQAETGFHFGVRVGDTYLDPAVLLTPVPMRSTPAKLVPVTLAAPSRN